MKTITIIIGPDGTPTVEGGGMVGKECDQLLKPFEDAFGKVTERTDKPEYHQTPVTKQKIG